MLHMHGHRRRDRVILIIDRGVRGMPPKIFWCFHALRELLVQSEANNYSTAIAPTENHDVICCG